MHNFCIILIFIIIACFPVGSLAKDPYDKDIVYVVAYKNLNKLKKLLSSKKFDDEDLNAAISIAITLKKFDMAEVLYLSMENDDRTLGMNMVNSNIKEPYTTKNVRKYIRLCILPVSSRIPTHCSLTTADDLLTLNTKSYIVSPSE